MYRTTARIDGMMCGMCEAHVNDAIRAKISVKKVTASHTKGEAVILSEEPVTGDALKTALAGTGYEVLEVKSEPYEKKKLFGIF